MLQEQQLNICPHSHETEGGCGYLDPQHPPARSLVDLKVLLGFMEHPYPLSPAHSSDG